MRTVFVLFALCAFMGVIPTSQSHSIKHFVVLMLENRSFDHMLGFLKQLNPAINGLNGGESNPLNTSDPRSPLIYVNPNSAYKDPDPCHSVACTTQQVFGDGPRSANPPPMSGFAENGQSKIGDGQACLSMFNPKTVPVISTLAQQFALFDSWFASVPGPTEVNRMFAQSGTSYGSCTNSNITQIIPGYPQRTIFQNLDEAGYSWRVYFQDLPSPAYFAYVRKLENLSKFRLFSTFANDCNTNSLPTYSVLEPRYFEDFGMPANDQHPSHDVSEGERLIKEVYETLRNSPSWNDTLLLLTYDEHGGFYDHVPTPLNIPSGDGLNCTEPVFFDFKRLGVRIPTIAVSPWIDKGVLVHDPVGPTNTSRFDHTSTLATIKKVFGLPNFINRRDAWAGTYESVFSNRTTPRTDCPTTLPVPPRLRQLPLEGTRPLSDLQETWVILAAGLIGEEPPKPMPETEGEGREFVMRAVSRFLRRDLSAPDAW